MRFRTASTSAILLLASLTAAPKDKKKAVLPTDVLQARTVWVVIDPNAGVDIRDPNANNSARAAVENALARWGRLSPVTSPEMADLIIVIRKGSGKLVEPTIGGTPINSPPPAVGQQTDSSIGGASRAGPPPFGSSEPRPQVEAGNTDDSFLVYRGNHINDGLDTALDTSALWRYTAKDALASPAVPAVEAFHDAIAESEKALAAKKP
jgi:hypothetical protein